MAALRPAVAGALLAVVVALGGCGGEESTWVGQKRACAYADHSIRALAAFGRTAGREFDCAVVFNDQSLNWAAWEKPWFTTHADADRNWANWVKEDGDRHLVITQNLFPAELNGQDWLAAGARGDYEEHARALARNLVAAGLGDSAIRLAHEANGTSYPYSLGQSDQQLAQWREFWRRTVKAMRSVDGADFTFDWTVNAAYRPIALDKWYPGDDVVDVVGIDAYDSGVKPGQPRWRTVYDRKLGLRDVTGFAKAHGKPLSLPEWGIVPPSKLLGGGDDPEYVDGIARVIDQNDVAYHGYFYSREFAAELNRSPRSLAAYRRHFGQ